MVMKFVNENIYKRFMDKKDLEYDMFLYYDDYEFNDKNLFFLENRIMVFYVKYGGKFKMYMKLFKLVWYVVDVSIN